LTLTSYFLDIATLFRVGLKNFEEDAKSEHVYAGGGNDMAAQRSASGAPLARMKIGTNDGTRRTSKTPRFTGRTSGVTCTRLLGRQADTIRIHMAL